MRTARSASRPAPVHGNVLLAALCTGGVVGIILLAYLSLTGNFSRANYRSKSWNAALVVAEAGLEEALAHLNQNKDRARGGLSCCGWTGAGTNYSLRRTVGDGYFVVNLSTNRDSSSVITSQGFVRKPVSGEYLSRTAQIICTNKPTPGGLVLKQFLDLNGNNIVIDSYDSTDPNRSTLGLYDPAKRGDRAVVVIESGVQDSLSIGNGDIWGTASVGPATTFTVGPSGSLGDLAWHNAGMSGVQPGAVTDDALVTISDSPAAPTGGVPPLVAAPGFAVDGIGYEFYLVDKGVYEVARLDRSTYVYGNARLVVSGDMVLDSTALLGLAPTASLTIYVHGSVSVKSGNVVNTGGRAKNLMIYGMNTCTSVKFSGSASYIGQLHAPYAHVQAGGGGGSPLGFCGALTAKSLTMIGHFSFHFDESLLGSGNRLRNLILTWNEL